MTLFGNGGNDQFTGRHYEASVRNLSPSLCIRVCNLFLQIPQCLPKQWSINSLIRQAELHCWLGLSRYLLINSGQIIKLKAVETPVGGAWRQCPMLRHRACMRQIQADFDGMF